MFDVTNIVEALFWLIVAIITTFVIPYVRSKTTESQQTAIKNWVSIAVTAAEQIYKGSCRGQEKKEYVLNWLTAHRIKIDAAKIDAIIEAAVYEFKHGLVVNTDTTAPDEIE